MPRTLSEAHKAALSAARKGRCFLTPETRAANAARMKAMNDGRTGTNHPRWVSDRTKLARVSQLRTVADVTWSRAVRRRFPKCVFQGGSYGECSGRLESHHIEPIIERPELRFVVENGVTLCRCHHPRDKTKVEQLKPVLKALTERPN